MIYIFAGFLLFLLCNMSKQKNGVMCICIDYHVLSKVTEREKNHFPVYMISRKDDWCCQIALMIWLHQIRWKREVAFLEMLSTFCLSEAQLCPCLNWSKPLSCHPFISKCRLDFLQGKRSECCRANFKGSTAQKLLIQKS